MVAKTPVNGTIIPVHTRGRRKIAGRPEAHISATVNKSAPAQLLLAREDLRMVPASLRRPLVNQWCRSDQIRSSAHLCSWLVPCSSHVGVLYYVQATSTCVKLDRKPLEDIHEKPVKFRNKSYFLKCNTAIDKCDHIHVCSFSRKYLVSECKRNNTHTHIHMQF